MTATSGRFDRWAPWLLAVAAVAVYAGSFHGPFVFDDLPSIRDHPALAHPWPLWTTWATPGLTTTARPLLALSLALNRAVSGDAVWSYHVANLAIHVCAGLALYGLLRRTPALAPAAFAGALLWLVHPLQTESVAYIVQRAESLMALCYLLTLLCFVRGRLVLSALCCLAGMLTKEVMVSAPVIVLLYDRTFVAGSFRAAWRQRRAYYCGLAATWLPLALLVLSAGGDRSGTSVAGVSWWRYVATQVPALITYSKLTVWPHPQAFDYGPVALSPRAGIGVAALALLALLGLTLRAARKNRPSGFLGLWFLAVLAPTSLVPGALQAISEHRMYLALAPLLTILVLPWVRWRPHGLLPLVLGSAIALGLLTVLRVRAYASAIALWTDTVDHRPENARAHGNLGDALRQAGRLTEAERQLKAAVALAPDFAEAHLNLGDVLLQSGRPGPAEVEYRSTIRLRPDLALAHLALGSLLAATQRADEGLREFDAGLRLDPGSFVGHYNLGNALFALNRTAEAAHEYEVAVALQPRSVAARYNDANALAQLGRRPEAVAQFEAVLRLQPDLEDAEFNLGGVLARLGRTAEARRHYAAAVRLNPGDRAAHDALAQLPP